MLAGCLWKGKSKLKGRQPKQSNAAEERERTRVSWLVKN